jgi:hypothetical protein
VKGAGPSCSGEGWKFLNPIKAINPNSVVQRGRRKNS